MATAVSRRSFLALSAGSLSMPLIDGRNWLGPRHLRRAIWRVEQEHRRVSIGVHLDGVPQASLRPLTELERLTGRIDLVSWYIAWGNPLVSAPHSEWLDAVSRSGRKGMITWEPWAYENVPVWHPSRINSGDQDEYIRSWATAFSKRSDRLWFLRPMHEMNGNWYPWGDVDPNEYRAAWVRICDIFEEQQAHNVRWVWCPLVDDVSATGRRFEQYYPGHAYVDVLALDGYNWGSTRPENGGWRTPTQVFDSAYRRLLDVGNRQPVWFAEVGCAPEGGDKAAWVADLLARCKSDWPRVESVTFFALLKEQDWRIDAPDVARSIKRR